TEEAIMACLSGTGGFPATEVSDAIERLHKTRRVLYRPGISGTFCLWPPTSVDLEAAYERAAQAIRTVPSGSTALEEFLEIRPLVARRHYIETGNLRYFDVRYVPVERIAETAAATSSADGVVVVALCETKTDCDKAEAVVRSDQFKRRKECLL